MRDYSKPAHRPIMSGVVASLLVFLPGPAKLTERSVKVKVETPDALFATRVESLPEGVHGYTEFDASITSTIEISGKEGETQSIRVAIRFGLGETVIGVTDRYHSESCNVKSILEHERKHAGIILTVREQYAVKLRERIYDVLGEDLRKNMSDREGALQYVLDPLVKGVIDRTLVEFHQENRRRNAELDTDEAYKEDLSQCPKW